MRVTQTSFVSGLVVVGFTVRCYRTFVFEKAPCVCCVFFCGQPETVKAATLFFMAVSLGIL